MSVSSLAPLVSVWIITSVLCVCVCGRVFASVLCVGGSGQAIIMAAAVAVLQVIVGGVQTHWRL